MRTALPPVLWLAIICLPVRATAQPGEVRLLDRINPSNPGASAWRHVTRSVYPVTVLTPVSLLSLGYATKDKWLEQQGWFALGAVAGNVVVTQGLKRVVQRQRPYNAYPGLIHYYTFEKDSAFPSGHTSNAFAVATSLTLSFKKWYVAVPAYLWATAAGYSRLYLGQHYPTDVLAGAAVGAGSVVVSRWLTRKLFFRPANTAQAPSTTVVY